MIHYRQFLFVGIKELYNHSCGNKIYSCDEKSCCTRLTSKVTCKQCLKALERELKMAKKKSTKKVAKKAAK